MLFILLTTFFFSTTSEATAPKIEYTDTIHQIHPQTLATGFVGDTTGALKDNYREELIDKMKICESGDNAMAVNPCDKDFTPSYGCLQFKPDTLKGYTKKYNLADISVWEDVDTMNWIYDCEFQTTIFKNMLDDPDVVWTREFPDCYRNNRYLFDQYYSK